MSKWPRGKQHQEATSVPVSTHTRPGILSNVIITTELCLFIRHERLALCADSHALYGYSLNERHDANQMSRKVRNYNLSNARLRTQTNAFPKRNWQKTPDKTSTRKKEKETRYGELCSKPHRRKLAFSSRTASSKS